MWYNGDMGQIDEIREEIGWLKEGFVMEIMFAFVFAFALAVLAYSGWKSAHIS